MKIIVKQNEAAILIEENVKRATIFNNVEENNSIAIEGFYSDGTPGSYFIHSFDINNFDKIALEDD